MFRPSLRHLAAWTAPSSVRAGGHVVCKVQVPGVAVDVSAQWTDVATVTSTHPEVSPVVRTTPDGLGFVVNVPRRAGGSDAPAGSAVHVVVPELFSVDVAAVADVALHGKVQGDCRVTSSAGSVTASKLRGRNIHVAAGTRVTVHDVVEGGTVVVAAGDAVHAQRVLCRHLTCHAGGGGVRAAAVYANGGAIESQGPVDVDATHGNLAVVCAGGAVLGGVNGSVAVDVTAGSARVHVDSHAAGASSHVAASGDVAVSLSPPVHVDVDVGCVGGGCALPAQDAAAWPRGVHIQRDDDRDTACGVLRVDAGGDTQPGSGKISNAGRASAAGVAGRGRLTVRAGGAASIAVMSWMDRIRTAMGVRARE